MEFAKLIENFNFEPNSNFEKNFNLLKKIIDEIKKRDIPQEIVNQINKEIVLVNSSATSRLAIVKQIRKSRSIILKVLEKELKLVPKNHYRNQYMSLGIALGLPFGAAFGSSLGNMAFIGIGLPIGMAIGIAIGSSKDAEAERDGKQLDIEVSW